MNKTVTINLGGIIFHIEEDAFLSLSKYLSTIKSYFKDSEGKDEIMTDIENRIAEMLSEKVSKGKQAILMGDVEEVIANMGKPEDFAGEPATEETKEEQASQPSSANTRKRIFRDPDEKILGGVCAGIGKYFGFDPLWLRLAWVLLVFLAGTGFLIYLILWIIIPKAKTIAEKLEMQGEPVTAANIGKKVEEELKDIKSRVNEFSEKAKNMNARPNVEKARNFLTQLFDGILQIAIMLLKTLGKIFGVVLLFVGTILAVLFAALLIGEKAVISITPEGVHSLSWPGITEFIFGSSSLSSLSTIGLIIVLGIPIIGLLYAGIRLLFGIKKGPRSVGITLTAIWFGGLMVCGVAAAMLASEFSEKGSFEKRVPLIQPAGNQLILRAGDDIFKDDDRESRHHHHSFHLRISDSTAYFENVKLDIQKSENDSFLLNINFIARGETSKEAIDLAKNINYEFFQEDSLMRLNTYFGITNQKWRNQKVYLTLKVPEGKSVFLDTDMEQIIYDVRNTSNTLDYDMVGKTWTMTKDGLTCVECK